MRREKHDEELDKPHHNRDWKFNGIRDACMRVVDRSNLRPLDRPLLVQRSRCKETGSILLIHVSPATFQVR